MAKKISAAKAQAELAELLTRVAESGERFVIERDGQPIAALVGATEAARLDAEPDDDSRPIGFRGLIGLWHDVDPAEIDKMVTDIYAAREKDTGRPVDLGD
jgi:prevent-host-death family protein